MGSYATCDVQMLRGKYGEYVVKEFSVFDARRDCIPKTRTFLPPYNEDKIPHEYLQQNTYVTQHVHGLPWNSGTLPYFFRRYVIQELTEGYSRLYVKGEEKKRLLQTLVENVEVINIESLHCPKLNKLAPVCKSHGFSYAAQNAHRVGLWLEYHHLV
jgi:hypothetical protein